MSLYCHLNRSVATMQPQLFRAQIKDFALPLHLLICILWIRIKCCKRYLQPRTCMPQFTVRTAQQLPPLLQAFRKEAGLTQSEVALRLGVSQQTYSAMERNADKVGAARLLKLLNILGVELALSSPTPASTPPSQEAPAAPSNKPLW